MKTLLSLTLLSGLLALAGCAGLANTKSAEPRVQQLVAEDDQVRIDELRVRGQTQRITIQPKGEGARPYEIRTAPAGSDPSKGREGVGQSLWPVLRF
jgi:outer membrane murein-binding lipoprotein Lpp